MDEIKKQNPWIVFSQKFMKEHPELPKKEAMKKAGEVYRAQNLKQASVDMGKSEQVNAPEEKQTTPLFEQEDSQLNKIPPAFNSPEIPITTPEEKIKEHLNKYGRDIIPTEEKAKLEKKSHQADFYRIFLIIILVLVSSISLYLAATGKFQTLIGDTTNNFNASVDVKNNFDNKYSPITNNDYKNNFTIIIKNEIYVNST